MYMNSGLVFPGMKPLSFSSDNVPAHSRNLRLPSMTAIASSAMRTRCAIDICAISVRRNNDGIEIARFGSLINTRVVGGFTKLLKYVESIYNPKEIVSFCDLRYGTGDVYRQAGFELISITPGWSWTDHHQIFNRLQCRANMDHRRLSCEEYAAELKWYQTFDAGQAKFVKKGHQ